MAGINPLGNTGINGTDALKKGAGEKPNNAVSDAQNAMAKLKALSAKPGSQKFDNILDHADKFKDATGLGRVLGRKGRFTGDEALKHGDNKSAEDLFQSLAGMKDTAEIQEALKKNDFTKHLADNTGLHETLKDAGTGALAANALNQAHKAYKSNKAETNTGDGSSATPTTDTTRAEEQRPAVVPDSFFASLRLIAPSDTDNQIKSQDRSIAPSSLEPMSGNLSLNTQNAGNNILITGASKISFPPSVSATDIEFYISPNDPSNAVLSCKYTNNKGGRETLNVVIPAYLVKQVQVSIQSENGTPDPKNIIYLDQVATVGKKEQVQQFALAMEQVDIAKPLSEKVMLNANDVPAALLHHRAKEGKHPELIEIGKDNAAFRVPIIGLHPDDPDRTIQFKNIEDSLRKEEIQKIKATNGAASDAIAKAFSDPKSIIVKIDNLKTSKIFVDGTAQQETKPITFNIKMQNGQTKAYTVDRFAGNDQDIAMLLALIGKSKEETGANYEITSATDAEGNALTAKDYKPINSIVLMGDDHSTSSVLHFDAKDPNPAKIILVERTEEGEINYSSQPVILDMNKAPFSSHKVEKGNLKGVEPRTMNSLIELIIQSADKTALTASTPQDSLKQAT